MDSNLVIIFPFIIVLAILVLGSAHFFHRRANAHEERKLELKARIAEANAGQMQSERRTDDYLEDRVRVLERIATDRSPDLAGQIEELRTKESAQ